MCGYVRVLLTHTQSELNSFQLSCSSFSCQFFFALFCHFHYILRSFHRMYFFVPCLASAPLCCILFLDIIHEGIFCALRSLRIFFSLRFLFELHFFAPLHILGLLLREIYVCIHVRDEHTYIHNF